MARLALSKSSLQKERKKLANFEKFLPSLDLKRRQPPVETNKGSTDLAGGEPKFEKDRRVDGQNGDTFAVTNACVEQRIRRFRRTFVELGERLGGFGRVGIHEGQRPGVRCLSGEAADDVGHCLRKHCLRKHGLRKHCLRKHRLRVSGVGHQ